MARRRRSSKSEVGAEAVRPGDPAGTDRPTIIEAVHRRVCGTARSFVLSASILLIAGSVACYQKTPPRIVVADNVVTVQNLTSEEWRDVEVWLNYHYRVTKLSMPPGQRFGIPLNVFVAGFGQRFDVRRQVVQTIQVKAKTKAGVPVDIMFGTGPRR